MKIRKAVITAAGKGTRQYPATNSVQKELFPLVDRDGITKPTIQIIAEQALQSGIEQICIVVQPGGEKQFRSHFVGLGADEKHLFANKKWGLKQSDLLDQLHDSITYLPQTQQEGYGHAVYCAREWVGDEPFLLMLGDHVYISASQLSCTQQLLQAFSRYQKSVYAIKQTPAELIYLFGTVTGERIDQDPPAYQLTRIVEKPDVKYAREHLRVEGLPADTFLSFFGMHVLTPTIFTILENHIRNNIRQNNEIQLTTAQAELCTQEGTIGVEVDGQRLDMGTPLGYIETQIALAMSGAFAMETERFFQRHAKH
ncbi:MAG TPA: sugar phosphate nucleotidyltransferase [bacterium]|nr:sugar phosphate nucleotidyltransferase [bacterium]HPG44576.1 sugar phosphate nucleotidyltransferase [bacterium]HPM97134.1 sugar phosphate nucleotidyltransferase [bacterium]